MDQREKFAFPTEKLLAGHIQEVQLLEKLDLITNICGRYIGLFHVNINL